MECAVCSRPYSSQLPFNCTTCARNALYEPRIDHARILLEKEDLSSKIEQATAGGPKAIAGIVKSPNLSARYVAETAKTSKAQTDQRTNDTKAHIDILRQEIRIAKQEISARKTSLAQRQKTLKIVQETIKPRRAASLEDIEAHMSRRDQTWHNEHKQLERNRAILCREAARLYGLQQKRRGRNGVIVEQYSIGGVHIPDLREINNVKPEELSAVMANISHLLVLTSNYLQVRLPAEITPPKRAYPRPTIFTPLNSYKMLDNPFPGSTPIQSSSTSPTASRQGDTRPLPRPRPLYTDKRLPQLAQDDSTAYALLIEGLCLLAWDVAWLCRSQGQILGTESWEEICNIGRNLWHLFIAAPSPQALTRARSSRDPSTRQRLTTNSSGQPIQRSHSLPRLGQYSHGAARHFLGNADGLDVLRSWKLARHTTVADPLKRTLLGEMSNAEWELLEEKEWEDGGGEFNEDEAVFVKTRTDQSNAWDDARSIMTARTKASMLQDGGEFDDSGTTTTKGTSGTSGWTKLKSRDRK